MHILKSNRTFAVRIVCAALLLLLLQPVIPAVYAAEEYTDGYFRFITEDGGIIITGYFGREETVTVPSMIAGVPVSGIAEGAFIGTTVKTLYLPETIMTIEQGAIQRDIKVIFGTAEDSRTDTAPDVGKPTEPETTAATDPIVTGAETEETGTEATEAEATTTELPDINVETEDATRDEITIDFIDDSELDKYKKNSEQEPGKKGRIGWIIGCSAAAAAAATAAVIYIMKKKLKKGDSNHEQ